jgi:hypothetical protein
MLRRSQDRNVRSLAQWSRASEELLGKRRGVRRGREEDWREEGGRLGDLYAVSFARSRTMSGLGEEIWHYAVGRRGSYLLRYFDWVEEEWGFEVAEDYATGTHGD